MEMLIAGFYRGHTIWPSARLGPYKGGLAGNTSVKKALRS